MHFYLKLQHAKFRNVEFSRCDSGGKNGYGYSREKKKNCVGAESATVKIVNNLHIIVL